MPSKATSLLFTLYLGALAKAVELRDTVLQRCSTR